MNTSTKLLGAALVLMLLAFPLTSVGTDRDLDWVWWLGLAVLAVGAAIPPIVRFTPIGDGDGDGDAEERSGRGAGERPAREEER